MESNEFNVEFIEMNSSKICQDVVMLGEDDAPETTALAKDVLGDDDESIIDFAIRRIIASTDVARFIQLLCPMCGAVFEKESWWRHHLNNIHFLNNFKLLPVSLAEDEENYRCNQCLETYKKTDYRKILKHCFTHMPYASFFKCSICEEVASEWKQMQQHIRRHMQQHMIRAKTERKIIHSKKIMLFNHRTDFEKYLNYICPSCLTQLRDEGNWMRHIQLKHNTFSEEKLNFGLSSPESGFSITATCNECGYAITHNPKRTDMRHCQIQHYLNEHLRCRAFRCSVCKMTFSYKHEIKLHMYLLHCKNRQTASEDDVQDTPAIFCNAPRYFELHKRFFLYEGEKFIPFSHFNCPMCNAKFEEYMPWNEHITLNHDFFKTPQLHFDFAVVDENKPYCLTCDREVLFQGHRSLWAHQLRHLPYSSYGCSICEENFNYLHLLTGHFRHIHTLEDGTISAEKKRRYARKVSKLHIV